MLDKSEIIPEQKSHPLDSRKFVSIRGSNLLLHSLFSLLPPVLGNQGQGHGADDGDQAAPKSLFSGPIPF